MSHFFVLIAFLSLAGFVLPSCTKEDRAHVDTYQKALENSPREAKEFSLRKNLQLIRDAIQVFAAEENRYPNSMAELADKGVLDHIPKDPFGSDYAYDPTTGKVKSISHPDY